MSLENFGQQRPILEFSAGKSTAPETQIVPAPEALPVMPPTCQPAQPESLLTKIRDFVADKMGQAWADFLLGPIMATLFFLGGRHAGRRGWLARRFPDDCTMYVVKDTQRYGLGNVAFDDVPLPSIFSGNKYPLRTIRRAQKAASQEMPFLCFPEKHAHLIFNTLRNRVSSAEGLEALRATANIPGDTVVEREFLIGLTYHEQNRTKSRVLGLWEDQAIDMLAQPENWVKLIRENSRADVSRIRLLTCFKLAALAALSERGLFAPPTTYDGELQKRVTRTASDFRRLFLLDNKNGAAWLNRYVSNIDRVPGHEVFTEPEQNRLTNLLMEDSGLMKQRFTRVVFFFVNNESGQTPKPAFGRGKSARQMK